MQSRVVRVFACLSLLAGSAWPVHGQEPVYSILSGGWSWPSGGPVESYESGFTLAGSFRAPVAPGVLSGLEVGYTWLSLDTAKLANDTPGSSFSGGDIGFLSVTTENDYLVGQPRGAARPFINLGMGYFRSFIDDASVTGGSGSGPYSTGVYEGSFFGFHGGVGVLLKRDAFGVRLDANYQYLFSGGDDLEFFPIRAGIIFYPTE